MSDQPTKRTQEFVADCPECHKTCWWCSGYLWTIREIGCMTIYPRNGKCKWAEAEKGKACGTCDGSRKVRVTQTIHVTAGGVAQP